MEIRAARLPEEWNEVLDIMSELQAHIARVDPSGLVRRKEDFDVVSYTQRLLEKVTTTQGVLLVATDGQYILGLAAGGQGIPSEQETLDSYPYTFGEIYELVVREHIRGKGIGAQLLHQMEEHFRTLGCAYVSLEVFAPNTHAHRFYLREGYTDRTIFVQKPL